MLGMICIESYIANLMIGNNWVDKNICIPENLEKLIYLA